MSKKYCPSQSTTNGIFYPTIPSGQTVYILGNVSDEGDDANKFKVYSRYCNNGGWSDPSVIDLGTISTDFTAESTASAVANLYDKAFKSNTYYVYTDSDNPNFAAIYSNSSKDALYSNMINLYLNKELNSNKYDINLKCSSSTMDGITYYGTFKGANGISFTSTDAAIYKCADDGSWDEQKPFYTVWWFWVIIALLVIIAVVPLFTLKKGQKNTWQWIVFAVSLIAAVAMVIVVWIWFFYF